MVYLFKWSSNLISTESIEQKGAALSKRTFIQCIFSVKLDSSTLCVPLLGIGQLELNKPS